MSPRASGRVLVRSMAQAQAKKSGTHHEGQKGTRRKGGGGGYKKIRE